jgi:predicted metal-dependent peptidase
MSKDKQSDTANTDRKKFTFVKTTPDDFLPPRQKVERATCELIAQEPFYAALLSRCVQEWTKRVPTMAVGFVNLQCHLFLSEQYVDEITLMQCIGDLKHEMMHLIMGHITRGYGFQHMPYNIAADIAIDQFIRNRDYFKEYKGIYFDDPEIKMDGNQTAEQYYYGILKASNTKKCPTCNGAGAVVRGGSGPGAQNGSQQNGQINGPKQEEGGGKGGSKKGHKHSSASGGNSKSEQCPTCQGTGNAGLSGGGGMYFTPGGKKLSDILGYDPHETWRDAEGSDREFQDEKIKQMVMGAYNSLNDRDRGLVPAHLKEQIEKLLNDSTTPWKAILSQFLYRATLAENTWTRKRPNRRYGWTYPANKNSPRLHVIIAIDTSGSICNEDLKVFFKEIEKIKGLNYEITIIECDAAVHRTYPYKRVPKINEVEGRGGTAFQPVFDYIAKNALKPNALLYLTDGFGDRPKKPKYPVLWVYTPNHTPVSWGRSIVLKY